MKPWQRRKPLDLRSIFRGGLDGGIYGAVDPDVLLRRRNLFTYSQQFGNAAWVKTAATVTDNADGAADKIIPTAVNSTHSVNQAVSVPYGKGSTRVRAKADGYNWILVQHGAAYANFNISTGAVGTIVGGATASIAAAVDRPGYFDCTVTNPNTTSTSALIYVANADMGFTFTGDGTSGVLLDRAQNERGDPTEYQEVTDWTTEYLAVSRSDIITQWAESTGVTPIVAAETARGLALDERFVGIRGAELVSATAITSVLGWSAGSCTLAVVGNEIEITATVSGACTAAPPKSAGTAGRIYEIQTAGRVGQAAGTLSAGSFTYFASTTSQTTAVLHGIEANGDLIFRFVSTAIGQKAYISLASVREVPGNHLLQATAAARPVVSQRYNQLLATATLATQSVTVLATSQVLSFTGTGTVTLTGVSTAGPLVGTGANDRVSLTFTPTAGSLTLTVTGSVTLADLRTADDAAKQIPAYQRVTSASDYDRDGFPAREKFDGGDDCYTSAGGGGSTTALSGSCVLTVLGGAGTSRTIFSDAGTNTGAIVEIDTNNKLSLGLGNGTTRIYAVSASALAVGTTYVLSWDYDGTNGYVQVNNESPVASASVTLSAGSAGFTEGKSSTAASGYLNGYLGPRVYGKNHNRSANLREQVKRELARRAACLHLVNG